jgi:hypothetical protein
MNAMLDARMVAVSTQGPAVPWHGELAAWEAMTSSSHGVFMGALDVRCNGSGSSGGYNPAMFPYDPILLAAVNASPQSVDDVLHTMQIIDQTCVQGDGLKWFNGYRSPRK